MPYEGVFEWAGLRGLESLLEDEKFTREAPMKSHKGPQHNTGVYATQPTGASQKTPKPPVFRKACGGIYGIPAFILV